MLHELQERLPAGGEHPGDLLEEALPPDMPASTAVELVAAIAIGLLLGIALGLQMELRSQRVAQRVGSYREAWQMLRGT